MFAMMMPNFVKVNVAKQLVRDSKALANWETITFNFYYLQHKKIHIYKRYISKNYWQFIVADDITRCTFKMYEKEAKNAELGNE
jgi:hypothetical protein